MILKVRYKLLQLTFKLIQSQSFLSYIVMKKEKSILPIKRIDDESIIYNNL